MGSVFGGGGGGGGGGPAPDTTTQFIREAPGIEERKMELMDLARRTAQTPISIPAIQVQGLSPLEKAAIRQAGKTGVGAGTVRQGIQSTLGASRSAVSGQQLANLAGTRAVGAAGLGQQQANLAGRGAVGAAGLGQQQAGQAGQLASLYGAGAMRTAAAGPSISQFFNPYQSYVIDEINRQAQQGQQRVAQQAISAGAFGGGREGVQRAEAERARLSQIGQAQAAGFESALGAAQRQQQLATQTGLQAGQLGLGAGQLGLSGAQLAAQTGLEAGQLGLSGAQLAAQTGLQAGQLGLSGGQLAAQTGLAAGQQLGALGQTQQQMTQQDINQLFGAGGVQRQIAQAQLDAARQTRLQRAAEPLQRLEFLSNIYAAGPKSTSGITAATLPQSSPLAQSIGTGLGVAQAYQGVANPAVQTGLAKAAKGGLIEAANYRVKKFNVGGSVSDDDDESADILNDEVGAVPQYISPEQRRNLMLRPLTSQLLQATRRPGQSEASAVAGALGRGLEGQQETALELTKYDAAVQAAKEKAKGTKSDLPTAFGTITGAQLGTGDPDDEYFGEVEVGTGKIVGQPKQTYDASEEAGKIRKAFADRKISKTDSALRDLELYIDRLAKQGKGGDLPGVGFFGGRSPITSTEGRILRSKLAAFQNVVLKERSGAAVTESELNRIVNELAGGETTKDEKALLVALNGARNALEREKLEVINSFGDQKALDKYLANEGIGLYDSPTFIQGVAKQEGAFMPIEGRNILEVDGKQVTFIGNKRFIYDPKKGKFYPAKDKK